MKKIMVVFVLFMLGYFLSSCLSTSTKKPVMRNQLNYKGMRLHLQ
jgi:hypothetical protein